MMNRRSSYNHHQSNLTGPYSNNNNLSEIWSFPINNNGGGGGGDDDEHRSLEMRIASFAAADFSQFGCGGVEAAAAPTTGSDSLGEQQKEEEEVGKKRVSPSSTRGRGGGGDAARAMQHDDPDSKRLKSKDQNSSKSNNGERSIAAKDGAAEQLSKPAAATPEPPKDYIHVRARRGQATDSHSLAERARREKISERMKILQDIVPGCNKVIGKALVLDEIINYIQSLQRQVEFLSMKLEAVNSRMSLGLDGYHPTKEFCQQLFDASGSASYGSQPSREYAASPEWLHMQQAGGGGFESRQT